MPLKIRILLSGIFLLFGSSLAFAGSDQGKLYILGMGPAGPDLTAPRALNIVQKADFILCSPLTQDRFQKYVSPEKVPFNPWEGIHGKGAGKLRKTDYQAWKKRVEKRKKKIHDFALEQIEKGKTIAMLDSGDPCVYGPSLYWLCQDFPKEDLEMVPGISAFNAASAALEMPMVGKGARSVLLTSPSSLLGDAEDAQPDILKDLSKYEFTMVFYMALKKMPKLVSKMLKYYSKDLPVAIVYYAGYPEKEKVLKGNLGNIVKRMQSYDESWLGMVLMGKTLASESEE